MQRKELELRKKIKDVFGSQIAFAFHLKENDSLVSKVLNGWQILPAEKQERWAKALGEKPENLFRD